MSNETGSSLEERRLAFDRERHARERWWREDELVNQRTTWLLTTQAVLGTAYGFVRYRIAEITHRNLAKTPYDYDPDRYLDTLRLFANCLVAIGIVGSIVSLIGIYAAHQAQRALQRHYGDYLGVSPTTTLMGHWTALATPLLFIVAWAMAFIVFLCNCQSVPQCPAAQAPAPVSAPAPAPLPSPAPAST